MVAQVWGQFNYMNQWGMNPFMMFACPQMMLQQQMQQMYIYRAMQQQAQLMYSIMLQRQMQQMALYRAVQQPQINIMPAYNCYPQINPINYLNNNYTNLITKIPVTKPETTRHSAETEVEAPVEETTPKKTAKPTETAEQKLTPQIKQQIINGTYSAPYVKINGITHYRYADCDSSKLVSVGNDKMHKDAAAAFNKMAAAAAKEGITLTAYSPLRTKSTQISNFSNKMKTKGRSFEENLKWSAPGGFSEHHTGYAVDINCASNSFGNSKEYAWLKKHANEYGFELSFPQNNCQGIGYEPWHWRFVGTAEAKNTFAEARAAAKANGQKLID